MYLFSFSSFDLRLISPVFGMNEAFIDIYEYWFWVYVAVEGFLISCWDFGVSFHSCALCIGSICLQGLLFNGSLEGGLFFVYGFTFWTNCRQNGRVILCSYCALLWISGFPLLVLFLVRLSKMSWRFIHRWREDSLHWVTSFTFNVIRSVICSDHCRWEVAFRMNWCASFLLSRV